MKAKSWVSWLVLGPLALVEEAQMHPGSRSRKGAALAALLAVLLLPVAVRSATVEETGYLAARDGTRLRYHVVRPAEGTRFPVLVNYEGYAAGTNAADNGVSVYLDRLIERGYAVMGVSVRGTGCSQGAFDPFEASMGTDGYDAIEWAASLDRPWSDGRVGMIGVSFGGITQLLTAAQQPPHLKAIAASSALSDLYRDVAYPGGILEYDFTFAWTGVQKAPGTEALVTNAVPEVDTECVANYAAHEAANTNYFIPKIIVERPFADDTMEDDTWQDRAPETGFPRIEVPTFLLNAWQDEQLPARIWDALPLFANQGKLWVNVTNGNHGRDYSSSEAQQLTLDFLDHFVRDLDNGFEGRVTPVSIWMETRTQVEEESEEESNVESNVKTWSIDLPGIPNPTPRSFYLRAGGKLGESPAAGEEAADSYAYPLPAPDVVEPGSALDGHTSGQIAWKVPVPPGGSVAYTSEPMSEDVVVAGPASLDLWLSSTATDTDLQATVTEVRPDGQETYVQRGWLRASHRKLDPARSTVLRPYHTHARGDQEPLTPNETTLMQIEVFPFAHAFRAGSRLRVWVEAPTSHTGFWAFAPTPDPAVNKVLHDADHPSRLVVGVLDGEVSHAPLPACDTLRNQPCRPDPLR